MEDVSKKTLNKKEYFKVECQFEGKENWVRSKHDYDGFHKAARAGSVFMGQEDVQDYRLVKVEKKETLIHP